MKEYGLPVVHLRMKLKFKSRSRGYAVPSEPAAKAPTNRWIEGAEDSYEWIKKMEKKPEDQRNKWHASIAARAALRIEMNVYNNCAHRYGSGRVHVHFTIN